jgi:hypothetical protein
MIKQLPEEAQLFQKVDVQWKEIMRRTNENPNALKACINPQMNMLAAFKSFNKDLEEVRKQMERFLETRRAMVWSPHPLCLLSGCCGLLVCVC